MKRAGVYGGRGEYLPQKDLDQYLEQTGKNAQVSEKEPEDLHTFARSL